MAVPNPVPGGAVSNNFGDCRGGAGCPRRHKGVDIMAAEGAPIYAPVPGKVVKVNAADTGLGGLSVWVEGADGRAYYFAHLSKIAVKVGDALTVGTPLGNVGHTGDADASAPHLHFSINGRVGAENPVVDPYTVIDRTLKLTPQAGQQASTAATAGATGNSSSTASGDGCSGCLIKLPGGGVPLIGGLLDACLLSRCQGQALVGGAALVAGVGGVLVGALVLVAYSLKGMGAKAAVASVPGGAFIGAAASAVTPSGRQAKADRQQDADVKAAEQEARMAAAQNRQEAAESKSIRRRQTSFAV